MNLCKSHLHTLDTSLPKISTREAQFSILNALFSLPSSSVEGDMLAVRNRSVQEKHGNVAETLKTRQYIVFKYVN